MLFGWDFLLAQVPTLIAYYSPQLTVKIKKGFMAPQLLAFQQGSENESEETLLSIHLKNGFEVADAIAIYESVLDFDIHTKQVSDNSPSGTQSYASYYTRKFSGERKKNQI